MRNHTRLEVENRNAQLGFVKNVKNILNYDDILGIDYYSRNSYGLQVILVSQQTYEN
jgi:hypothetical protein